MKISGVVIAYNEEKNIQRCLTSLKEVVDELIVVDSHSTDQTRRLAQALGAKVISQEFLGYIEQKNFALDAATHPYILSLDADEELSPQLRQSIQSIRQQAKPAQAYSMNRMTRYIDQWITHCDWYPDKKIRLWHRSAGRWGGQNPHDLVVLSNGQQLEHLAGDILHYSYNSISEHVEQTNRFTSIAARTAFAQGVRSSNFKIVTRPLLKFMKDYFLRAGFLEGRYGFIICYINALSAFLKYAKIKEIQDGRNP